MTNVPDLILVPNSQAAALRYLLECVENGYYHYTRGSLSARKVAGFAVKMAGLYPILATRGARQWSKSQGRANVRLVIFPTLEDPTMFHYFILATEGTGDIHEREQLSDARNPAGRLQFWKLYDKGYAPAYELVARPINGRNGVTHRWTWVMSDFLFRKMGEWLARGAARARSSHAKRADYLFRAIQGLRAMPGFNGIRQQKRQLVQSTDMPQEFVDAATLDKLGGYVDKALTIFNPSRTLSAVLVPSLTALSEATKNREFIGYLENPTD
jgi:hypothetical protein